MESASFEDPKLQALLEKIAKDENFTQPKFTINIGSEPGDNFVGRIYRAVVKETDKSKGEKSLSLIFKASPLSPLRREMLSSDRLFANEKKTYLEVLPALHNFLKEHGLVDSACFPGTARCYAAEMGDGSREDDVHVLVLEDKAVAGFRMGDRKKGLDIDHIRLVLEKLALWHASSLALMQHEPEEMKRITDDLAHKHIWYNDEKHPMLDESRQGLIASLGMLKEPFKKGNPMYDRLEKIVDNFNSEFVRLSQVPTDLGCINHGDCWTNNMLFQYNEDGSVKDVCLIDLQLTRIGTPVNDLVYHIFLCTTKEIRDAHYDDMIHYYHSQTKSYLKALGCDPQKLFPWERLQAHLKDYGVLGPLCALVSLPVFLAKSSDINVDVNSKDHKGNIFSGSADITDLKKREEISKRLTDVVIDAVQLEFF